MTPFPTCCRPCPASRRCPGPTRHGRCGLAAPPRRSASSPCPRRPLCKLWHRARDFDRGTHQPGRHGGALGHTALAVLHALIFDFLNHRTGRLDPSYAAIARKAGVCVRTVATALRG